MENDPMPHRGRRPGGTTTIGLRIDARLKAALERAAVADHRTMTSLIEKLIADHVSAHGFLEEPEPPKAPATRRRG